MAYEAVGPNLNAGRAAAFGQQGAINNVIVVVKKTPADAGYPPCVT